MKVVITKSGIFKQKWSFKFIGDNNKILMVGEKYYNYQDMMNTLTIIRDNVKTCIVENKYV